MKLIELTGKYGSIIGNYAMVDDEDYEYLMQWKWGAYKSRNGKNLYAKRTRHTWVNKVDIASSRSMHMELIQAGAGKQIDHKDRNGLNNQRSNLRICTHGQNQVNKIKMSKKNKYKGVHNAGRGWQATCKKDKKTYRIACRNEIQAAIMYNKLAIELHGEFANLNIITDEDLIWYKQWLLSLPVVDTETHKRCRHCNITKDRKEFYKIKKGTDGNSSWCIKCRNEHRKIKRNENNTE